LRVVRSKVACEKHDGTVYHGCVKAEQQSADRSDRCW
jgi:hypothetical protein